MVMNRHGADHTKGRGIVERPREAKRILCGAGNEREGLSLICPLALIYRINSRATLPSLATPSTICSSEGVE